MFHMCRAVPSIFVFIVTGLLCWAARPVAAVHVDQAAGGYEQCPAGLRDAFVELNSSNFNQEIPGLGKIVGAVAAKKVEDVVCKKASVLAKPIVTKCQNTLDKVSHHVDELLNGTLEAGKELANSSANTSTDVAARLDKFENYSYRVLNLGVDKWHRMYDIVNLIAPMAEEALEEAGMYTLAKNLGLDRVNKTLIDILRTYRAARKAVHGISNKNMTDVGITLTRLNETMKTGLKSVDAFAQALNETFIELTDGLGTGLTSLLPKSCKSFWKPPLESAGSTFTNITLKVQDSVHRLASDLVLAGEQLGIKPIPLEPSRGSRFMLSRPVILSVMAVVAAFAGFPT